MLNSVHNLLNDSTLYVDHIYDAVTCSNAIYCQQKKQAAVQADLRRMDSPYRLLLQPVVFIILSVQRWTLSQVAPELGQVIADQFLIPGLNLPIYILSAGVRPVT